MFLIDATGSATRVRTNHGIDQGAKALAVIRRGGYLDAVVVGRTSGGTRSPKTGKRGVIKVSALSERERAITITDREGTRERKALAAVVRGDESTLLGDHNVRAIVGDCNLQLAVVSEIVQSQRRKDRRLGTGGFNTRREPCGCSWRGNACLGRVSAPRQALKRIQFLLDLSWVADCRKCETPANGEHQLLELLVSIRRQLRLEADQQIIRRDCGRDLHHVTIREKRSVSRVGA